MKLPKYSYAYAKNLVKNNIGEDVYFIRKESRGKIIKQKGTIENAYQNIFTISTTSNNKQNTLTFSYCDIINHSIILNINKRKLI
ncbi:Veg family protein [Anaerofustis butyriciformans]|uniref:Veg family protein n=1 Tax=Anaerofustis TaxID=264995 RepID=UPI003F8B7E1E